MSVLTFDWAQISFIGSPLATPWWAEANVAFGFVFFFCEHGHFVLKEATQIHCQGL